MKIEKVHTITLNEEDLNVLRAAQKVLGTVADETGENQYLCLTRKDWDGETVCELYELLCDIIINADTPMEICR